MDQSYQLYIFILSITTLFTDIKPTGDFSHNWFDAQKNCYGQGLTIGRDKSEKPYWTGISRRLTPWINILGCYSDSIKNQDVVKKTMMISSVGMCQELCYHENGNTFALKMNNCLCIERNLYVNLSNKLPPSACNYTCEDNSDVLHSRDCGGERAYNLFEYQGVNFNTTETCLSLQCSTGDIKFYPKSCFESLDKVCEEFGIPDHGFASSWNASMEQCKRSQQSAYLLGDLKLNNPHLVCTNITHQVVWVGVARHKYKSIDQGCRIKEKDKATFQDCQMCTKDNCCFKSCFELITSPIYCQSISDTSQSQENANLTKSSGSSCASNFMSTHLTAKQLFAPKSITGNCNENQLASIKDTQQKSSASDNLALKISLPLIIGFIILLLCAAGVVFYRRRNKMTKTNRTTKAEVESVPRPNVDSKVKFVQNHSYFVLDQCSQKIHTVSDSSNESPYNNSEEGVYDHLREKQARKPEVEDTYQHATGTTRDMSEYDTMANTVHKKQEEDATYDYSHQDTNENYGRGLRANNFSIDSPYDVTV